MGSCKHSYPQFKCSSACVGVCVCVCHCVCVCVCLDSWCWVRLHVYSIVCVSHREIYAQDVVVFPAWRLWSSICLSLGGFSTPITVKDKDLSSHLCTLLHFFFFSFLSPLGLFRGVGGVFTETGNDEWLRFGPAPEILLRKSASTKDWRRVSSFSHCAEMKPEYRGYELRHLTHLMPIRSQVVLIASNN